MPSWTIGSRWRPATPPQWKDTCDVRLDLAQTSRADGGACAVGAYPHPGSGGGALLVGVPRTGAAGALQRTNGGRFRMSTILVIDNYDSFVYTIVGYLQQLGAETTVVRNDDPSLTQDDPLAEYDGVLISPGPGTPKQAGESMAIVGECARTETPLLGVCLGHQALGEYYGATVGHSPELMHGKTSRVQHQAESVFAGLPTPLTATRYHSLAVLQGTVPADL